MTDDQSATPAEPTCSSCGQLINEAYYEVNGRVTCEDCRIVAEEQFNLGGGATSLLRATALGLLAAAAGFGIYYGVARLTGTEYGIVAALIGLIVGAAVRRGSRHRGGWRYQVLAMFLTYTAIVASYAPALDLPSLYADLLHVGSTQGDAQVALLPNPSPGPNSTGSTSDTSATAAGADSVPADQDTSPEPLPVAATTSTPGVEPAKTDLGNAILGALALVAFIYAVPFLSGIENLIGLVIIGVALFEAWHLNRRGKLHITGPHDLAAAA